MDRISIINKIGKEYYISNIEGGEYSYVQVAGSKEKLEKELGHKVKHFKLDIRFKKNDVVILVETKQKFVKSDEKQLEEYLEEEKILHKSKKIICILANTKDNEIKVWKSNIDEKSVLKNEVVLDTIEHYESLFNVDKVNDKQKVLQNTYDLNELLHKKDIDEKLRSQFVGTTLLYLKDLVKKKNVEKIDEQLIKSFEEIWEMIGEKGIIAGMESTLTSLLDSSENKETKIKLLQKNVLEDQKIKNLDLNSWIEILKTILMNIYVYIDTDSSEGQDILNLFFIAFNKYTGKADRNQAFTPDHITDFMCRLTEIDRNKIVLDATCGSGSFLVQAMVKELADCKREKTETEAKKLQKKVKENNIYGIEVEEKAYGLATTNMLIHGDGNSNIRFASCFDSKEFIKNANPDVILMNPPYNAKPISIPKEYKENWSNEAKNGKEDPTKGFVFIRYLSDIVKEINEELEEKNQSRKKIKLAVLLPVSVAIGTKKIITEEKIEMLKENTLEAVFTLPDEIFYPGSSVNVCCMLFTLGQPHKKINGSLRKTFFGYYKEDGFRKKKNIGRIEQFDSNGNSIWKNIEEEWLELFENKKEKAGKSAIAEVDGTKEWLCEAYMKTDYSFLTEADFIKTIRNYYSYMIKYEKEN